MERIELKDVLHYYLGCECEEAIIVPGQELEFVGSIDLNIRHIYNVINNLSVVRLRLRPLSDMTEEEMKECGNLAYDFSDEPTLNKWEWENFQTLLDPIQFIWLLKQGFDLFNLIPHQSGSK